MNVSNTRSIAYWKESLCGILKEIIKSVAVAEMIPALLLIPSETTMTIMTKSGSSINSTKFWLGK